MFESFQYSKLDILIVIDFIDTQKLMFVKREKIECSVKIFNVIELYTIFLIYLTFRLQ